jgi:hypothetical protein
VSTIREIREALKARVESATYTESQVVQWKAYAYAPLTLVAPCVIPSGHEGDLVTMDDSANLTISLFALVPLKVEEFQEWLDEILEGDRSIPRAINADDTLGLPDISADCAGWDSFGTTDWAGSTYWSVRMPVTIMRS